MNAHRLRFCAVALAAALLSIAWLSSRSDAQPNTVKEIVKGVWFREGDIKNQGHCNNAIIEMKDYLIVVDANFPSGARLAMEDAKKVSPKPVKYVFDTHHHGDHLYGNPVWTKAGATTLAYSGVVDELKRYEPKSWQGAVKERKDVAELNLPGPEPPKQTFSKTPFVLEDSTRRVEFHFYGWAHTRGDGLVFLPKERVLCTGDAIVNGPWNYTGQGNITNWPSVIRASQRLHPLHILPGHGPAGGPEVLDGQLRFMIALRSAVDAAVKQGKKVDDLVPQGGKPSLALPDDTRNWVGDFLGDQIKDAYKEVTTGKPAGGE